MSLSSVSAKDYEDKSNPTLGENKPNSNPIQSQTKPISPPPATKQTQFKPKQTQPVVSLHVLSQAEGPNLFQATCTPCKFFLFLTLACRNYNPAMQTWTIQKLLNWVTEYLGDKGIESPRLSAELLLAHVLELKRIELYTQFDRPVAKHQLNILHDLVKRAGQDEPIAYLTGKTEFYSLELTVTRDCLIPRPETELLVERAIEFLRTRTGNQFVCDLCTGCGCIAVAIAKNFHNARIIATDISDAALNIAAQNVEKHQLQDKIELLQGDLFEPIVPHLDVDKLVPDSDRGFDLIVCNPPYVSATEYQALDRNVQDYEPKSALLAGVDGLDVYRRIIEKADQFLKDDAALMLEIGYAQGGTVKELLEQTGTLVEIKIERDFHDNDRIAIAKKKILP